MECVCDLGASMYHWRKELLANSSGTVDHSRLSLWGEMDLCLTQRTKRNSSGIKILKRLEIRVGKGSLNKIQKLRTIMKKLEVNLTVLKFKTPVPQKMPSSYKAWKNTNVTPITDTEIVTGIGKRFFQIGT